MRIAVWVGLVAVLASCSVPPTVQEQQFETLRDVKLYLKNAKGWDPDQARINYDDMNSAWRTYWSSTGLTMLPEHKKWNDRIHDIWIYQAIPPGLDMTHVLWVFVDRRSGEILGDQEAH